MSLLASLATSIGLVSFFLEYRLPITSRDGGLPSAFLATFFVADKAASELAKGRSSGNESKDAKLATDCLCSRLGVEGIDILRYGGICVEMLPWW